jgi:membrane protease YdiL (CAAX protease family)
VIEGSLVERRTWTWYFVRTLVLLAVTFGVLFGSVAVGAGPAQGNDGLTAVTLGGVALGMVLFIWATVRAFQGPQRRAVPGRIEIPYVAIEAVDTCYDWTWFLLGGFIWMWFVGRKVVRARARWYPQDRRVLPAYLAVRDRYEAAAFCATLRTAKAYQVARRSMTGAPLPVG